MKKNKKIFYWTFAASMMTASALSAGVSVSTQTQLTTNIEKVNEFSLFSNNDDVKEYFYELNNKNNIIEKKGDANIEYILDSYQQSNKLSNSKAKTTTYNFKYQKVIEIGWTKFNSIERKEDFKNELNKSKKNEWSYNVSEWEAVASKRFVGTIIVMPFWAPEVRTKHASKNYSHLSNKNMQKITKFAVNELREVFKDLSNDELISLCNFVIDNIQKNSSNKTVDFIDLIKGHINPSFIRESMLYLLNILEKKFINEGNRLYPNLKTNKNDSNENIKGIDFGVVKAKLLEEENSKFWTNNSIPIFDYQTQMRCDGPTCSHNMRHLFDVIYTSTLDIIANHFGNRDSYLHELSMSTVKQVLHLAGEIWSKENELLGKINTLVNSIEYVINRFDVINNIVRFAVNNLSDITLELTGKVEKHGVQLGKCGHLVSGVKIDRYKNIVNIKNPKPFVIYNETKLNNIFNHIFTKNSYNFNTLTCIVELVNYKKLYEFIQSADVPIFVKSNLSQNIYNLSMPSSKIYEQYLEYINNNINPLIKQNKMPEFTTFLKEGWKIPDNINYWDILGEQIIPAFFSEGLSKIKGKNREVFFKDFEFLNTSDNISENIVPNSIINDAERFIF